MFALTPNKNTLSVISIPTHHVVICRPPAGAELREWRGPYITRPSEPSRELAGGSQGSRRAAQGQGPHQSELQQRLSTGERLPSRGYGENDPEPTVIMGQYPGLDRHHPRFAPRIEEQRYHPQTGEVLPPKPPTMEAALQQRPERQVDHAHAVPVHPHGMHSERPPLTVSQRDRDLLGTDTAGMMQPPAVSEAQLRRELDVRHKIYADQYQYQRDGRVAVDDITTRNRDAQGEVRGQRGGQGQGVTGGES